MSIARVFARVKHLEIYSARILEGLLTGNYRSVFKGPGLEFAEARQYTEGDDPRQIDWNVSSRLGSLYTKTFREERELNLFLLVDLSASVSTGQGIQSMREALDLLFSVFSFAAIQNNDKVGACFFTDRIEHWVSPARGKSHAMRLIQDLLTIEAQGKGSDLALALRTSGEALKRRGICVVLSDFKTSAYKQELAALARRHDVIAIRLVSPEDVDFPQIGSFWMQDTETGAVQPAWSDTAAFRRSYRDFWIQERKQWFQDCRRRGVSAMEIYAGEDPLHKLFNFFQRRKQHRWGR